MSKTAKRTLYVPEPSIDELLETQDAENRRIAPKEQLNRTPREVHQRSQLIDLARRLERHRNALRRACIAAEHALRSYETGNSAGELAKEVADVCAAAIRESMT